MSRRVPYGMYHIQDVEQTYDIDAVLEHRDDVEYSFVLQYPVEESWITCHYSEHSWSQIRDLLKGILTISTSCIVHVFGGVVAVFEGENYFDDSECDDCGYSPCEHGFCACDKQDCGCWDTSGMFIA